MESEPILLPHTDDKTRHANHAGDDDDILALGHACHMSREAA
jgi:hypothetical protein